MNRLLTICIFLIAATGCAQDPEPIVLGGSTMGTTWSARIADDVDAVSLRAAIETELEAVNAAMSTYIADSEISRFNRSPVDQWFPVSRSMIEMIDLSKQIHAQSGGKFDPTIGPLVNLWGFGPVPVDGQQAPFDPEIAAAMARVSLDLIDQSGSEIRRQADVYLDLSSIAKGYGVDRMAKIVEAAGSRNYLVEIGGELRAAGKNERGTHWTIAIERPDFMTRTPFTTVALRDEAIATSGDYRNYYEIDGTRYSHLIDPTTGRPIVHNLASVTVLAPTTAMADGYATAIYVMGAEAGLALAEAQGLAVFAIIKADGGFKARYSSAFEAYLK